MDDDEGALYVDPFVLTAGRLPDEPFALPEPITMRDPEPEPDTVLRPEPLSPEPVTAVLREGAVPYL